MKQWDRPFESRHHRLIAVLCRFHLATLSRSDSMSADKILRIANVIKSLNDKLPKEKPKYNPQLKVF